MDISTGVFHSENLEPVRHGGVPFGQFAIKTEKIRKAPGGYDLSPSNLCFKLDKPYGSFFTAAQFVSKEGSNQRGMGVFGVIVRDWDDSEAYKMHHALHEGSLNLFLKKLKETNSIFSQTLESLFTYNENYYFTSAQ